MISELWSAFPHLMVEKINGLLDEAEPTPARAYQIFKECQSENLWSDGYEKFTQALQSFYSQSRVERKKSFFDRYLDRPMGMETYEKFHLTFRSALVSQKTLLDIASWAHHLTRVGFKTTCPVASEDVFTKTLQYITNPPHFEKDENINFEDFCEAWIKVVTKIYGKTYEAEFNHLLRETRWHSQQVQAIEVAASENPFIATIYLTQTEIDWVTAVYKTAAESMPVPKFPLSRGPQKQRLIELNSTMGLYKLVQSSIEPAFVNHRKMLRGKILEQCLSLLRECAR
jgi:hypothetical protein